MRPIVTHRGGQSYLSVYFIVERLASFNKGYQFLADVYLLLAAAQHKGLAVARLAHLEEQLRGARRVFYYRNKVRHGGVVQLVSLERYGYLLYLCP